MTLAVTSPKATTTAMTVIRRSVRCRTSRIDHLNRLTNQNDDNPSNPVHLTLIDIFMNDHKQISGNSKAIVKDLYPLTDL
jgi:hypothetical protein